MEPLLAHCRLISVVTFHFYRHCFLSRSDLAVQRCHVPKLQLWIWVEGTHLIKDSL